VKLVFDIIFFIQRKNYAPAAANDDAKTKTTAKISGWNKAKITEIINIA